MVIQLLDQTVVHVFLVLMRVGAMMMFLPGLAENNVPMMIRLMLAVSISLAVASGVPWPPSISLIHPEALIPIVVSELLIGAFIGILVKIIFSTLANAANIIALQTGFANAMVFNPSLSLQGTVVGSWMGMVGLVLLFATNLHHMIFAAMVKSFEVWPLSAPNIHVPDMFQMVISKVSQSFLVGFQIAIPFTLVFLLTNIGAGVMGRLMPQFQPFFVMLPAQILLALFMMMILNTGMFQAFLEFITHTFQEWV